MAFDLNTALQANKRFLAGTVLAAGVFFAATALVDSFLGGDLTTSRNEVASARAKMSRGKLYNAKNLEAARAELASLEESVAALGSRLRFAPREAYQLKPSGGSPANQYVGIAAEVRERRLDDARSRGIDLVDHVGIPDRSPTDVEEIERTLRCLDLIDRVIGLLLLPGTRSIDRISVVSDRRDATATGRVLRDALRVEFEVNLTSQAFSQFIEASQALDPPITIESVDATAQGSGTGRSESLVRVLLTVSALEVEAGKE